MKIFVPLSKFGDTECIALHAWLSFVLSSVVVQGASSGNFTHDDPPCQMAIVTD